MKELLAAAVLIAIVAYLWMQPSSEPPPEPRESRRPADATVAAPVNNSTGNAGSIGVPPNTDGSLASRWKTGPSNQTNSAATIPDRWKTGLNAQSNLTVTAPDRWKTGPNGQTDLTATVPDRWKPGPK